MSTTGTRIEFRDVSKVFKTGNREVTAVDGVTLTVEPGEILGVIGYSGAGKSTLVRLINGLDAPTGGQLLLDGTDVVDRIAGVKTARRGPHGDWPVEDVAIERAEVLS